MLYSILPIALLLYVFLSASGAGVFVILAVASVLLSATATSSLVFTQKMMPRNIGMASGLTLGFSVGVRPWVYGCWEKWRMCGTSPQFLTCWWYCLFWASFLTLFIRGT